MLQRSETTFVRRVEADKRRRILNALYVSVGVDVGFHQDLLPALSAYCLLLFSCVTAVGSSGMVWYDINWGTKSVWTHTVWAGILGVAAVCAQRSLNALAHYPSVPSITAQLNCISMVGVGVMTSITMMKYIENNLSACISLVFATGLLVCSVLHMIYYRSFSGLFGPIYPSHSAPTIIPLFTTNLLGAVCYAVCVGLLFQPLSLLTIRLTNAFRLGAWVFWSVSAYSTLIVCYLTCHTQRRSYDTEDTPLTRYTRDTYKNDSSN